MTISKYFIITLFSALVLNQNVSADLLIQSAQYKQQKGALFVKGKLTDGSTGFVYVVDASTDRLIASVPTRGNQFRADLQLAESIVPCLVQIQTNRPVTSPWGSWNNFNHSSPGEFNVALVRHAPERCTQ